MRVPGRARIAAFPKAYLNDMVEGKLSLFEWIEMAGTLGVDGLEMYFHFFKDADSSYTNEVKQVADAQGLLIPMMCASPDFTQADAAARAREIEAMKRIIDITAYLGPDDFRSCRVLSGQNRPGIAIEDGIRWTVESINKLLPYAAEKKVHLVMENHYKDGFWIYPEFAQPADIFLKIIGQISSPWFGVNYDPSNALLAGEDPICLLKKVIHRTVTMHASDRYLKDGYTVDDLKNYSLQGYSEALAHGVIGSGLNDYDTIFSILQAASYHGWISIEDGINGLDEMRESAQFLRQQIDEYLTG
ncbi:sugar phosphate isomerase/epimerase family protein [Paenibacillus xerothermodurans]|uniref:Sugar phosphate isomerase/epimerase n=1 Tax=Paenibacillus xerothermodurans TaxID=1977292 RepID=A0A2W1NTN0_PAEXE|nr:sugar phosphate isomerase/epimerase family protein [Paenibacillus xerothermodurans]PZE21106.1 sugar phosphate isomerase/epimerase [Paenibacillus xerothermodurans]